LSQIRHGQSMSLIWYTHEESEFFEVPLC